MSATKTTSAGILKEVYEGPIRDQINSPNVLLKFINRNARDIVEGNEIVGSVRLVPSQGIGARAELTNLPTAGNTRHGKPLDALKHLYGVMRLSGPLIRAAENNAAAFARAMKAESEGLIVGLNLDQQRMMYGTATDDGQIVLTGVTAASLVVQLDASANMTYFEESMLVDLLTVGTGVPIANGTARTVESIDEVNKTITLDAAGGVVTTAATEAVYRSGNYLGEPHGLEAIVGTGILHNLNPATAGFRRWQSNVVPAFGAFTSLKLQAQIDKTHNKSGKWVSHIFSQEGPRNAYLAELQGIRRIVQQTVSADNVKLDGGFSGLEYTGGGATAVWFKDPACTNSSTIIAIHLADLELKRYADWAFMELAGEHWFPDIYGSGGQDAFKAVMFMDVQVWANARNSHLKLQGVTY